MELTEYQQLKQWVDEKGEFDLRSFVLLNTTVPGAAVLAEMFWPNFVEYREGVFLAFLFETSAIDLWFDKLKGDVPAVESTVNHVHLWDLFSPRSEDEYAGLSALAERMRKMWVYALRDAFPERVFTVVLTDGADDYGPTLTFSQRK